MSETLEFKRLNNDYCAAVIELILPIQQIEFNIDINLSTQTDLLDIEKYYDQSGGAFWGAVLNNRLIGTIALIVIPGSKYGAVRKMFVNQEFRGKGLNIAQNLLQMLIAYSTSIGIEHLYLGTKDVFRAACRFYMRNGFKEINKNQLPHDFPIMAIDNLFYHLDVDFSSPNTINAAGLLAISARLQRLSDWIRKDVSRIYQIFNIDFQPKWFPVLYTLYHKKTMSIVALSKEIGYAHPSTIALLKELERYDLIMSKKNTKDTRKRLIEITPNGLKLLNSVEPIWGIITQGLEEVTYTENNLLKAIEEVEAKLEEQNLEGRIKKFIK